LIEEEWPGLSTFYEERIVVDHIVLNSFDSMTEDVWLAGHKERPAIAFCDQLQW
jgi:hypothetical protein